MKKKSLVCLAFLCFLMSFMGVGCSATRESTDSSASKAHEDTQITEHTGHDSESSTKAETEEPILQTVIIQQVRDNSITVEHIVLLNSYLEEDLQTLKDLNIPPEEYQYGLRRNLHLRCRPRHTRHDLRHLSGIRCGRRPAVYV